MQRRLVFKLNEDTKRWNSISFKDLKVGDHFKMYEPVYDTAGNTVFVADSKPYPNPDNTEVLTIKTK